MNQLTRGQVAKQCGINRETVRYYERVGLLPEPRRSRSGYCLFPETTVEHIRFIKRAQSVGFSLDQIKTLVRIEAQTTLTIKTVIQSQILEIESKIQSLQSMRSLLLALDWKDTSASD